MIDFPATLVSQLARRKAIVVIGSGVSAQSKTVDTATSPKTWGSFLSGALKALPRPPQHIRQAIKEYRYLDACYYLKAAHDAEWLPLIIAEYRTPNYAPAPIHTAIQDLDCRIVISLNFDQIYERNCAQGTEGSYIVRNYYDSHLRECLVGNDNYILKMHGSIDAAERLIFNSEDYAKARTDHRFFYDVIDALALTHTLLFIGCGTSDPDVRYMLENHRYSTDSTPHYFLTADTIKPEEMGLLKSTRGLNILRYNKNDDHIELANELARLANIVSEKRIEIGTNFSW